MDGINIINNRDMFRTIDKLRYIVRDIKDFFKSISKEMVGNMFEKHFSNSKYISEITELVIYDKYLPTGAPTSPIISNFICELVAT